jgi:hypothetical protein
MRNTTVISVWKGFKWKMESVYNVRKVLVNVNQLQKLWKA